MPGRALWVPGRLSGTALAALAQGVNSRLGRCAGGPGAEATLSACADSDASVGNWWVQLKDVWLLTVPALQIFFTFYIFQILEWQKSTSSNQRIASLAKFSFLWVALLTKSLCLQAANRPVRTRKKWLILTGQARNPDQGYGCRRHVTHHPDSVCWEQHLWVTRLARKIVVSGRIKEKSK